MKRKGVFSNTSYLNQWGRGKLYPGAEERKKTRINEPK